MVSQWVENISIHAPPRGATRRTRFWQLARYFNSRPSARGDTIGKVIEQPGSLFQFTPLAGAWYFNSRPSARGDAQIATEEENDGYFNSRPSARGDGDTDVYKNHMANFNSRPSARGDAMSWCRSGWRIFQFTPLREGRHNLKRSFGTADVFQFTPLREGRRLSSIRRASGLHFNSRPSARGDKKRLMQLCDT